MHPYLALRGNPRVHITAIEVLSAEWSVLRRATFHYRRGDGTVSTERREAYDRGDGVAILLLDPRRDTVVLTRQFRLPAYLNGHPDGMLIEVPAGKRDRDDPVTAVRREAEEETGVRVGEVTHLFDAYMSPGSVTEQLAFFTATYTRDDRVHPGGGVAGEGEDIEVLEIALGDALAMVDSGQIADAKTIMLLQWARHRHPV